MDEYSQIDKKHDALITWVKERGVFIDGVRPNLIPRRGVGVVAERKIEVCESRNSFKTLFITIGGRGGSSCATSGPS